MTRLKLNPPTVTFEVYLVPHGFQANLFLPGKDPLVIIRDFPDSYPVEQLVASLSERLEMMLSDFHRQPVPARRLHLEEGGERVGAAARGCAGEAGDLGHGRTSVWSLKCQSSGLPGQVETRALPDNRRSHGLGRALTIAGSLHFRQRAAVLWGMKDLKVLRECPRPRATRRA